MLLIKKIKHRENSVLYIKPTFSISMQYFKNNTFIINLFL